MMRVEKQQPSPELMEQLVSALRQLDDAKLIVAAAYVAQAIDTLKRPDNGSDDN